MTKKVSIIGGSGFVGTHLCQYLAGKQQDFEIIDLKLSEQFPEKSKLGDVRDLESLKKTITGDVVVNLAAIHRDDIHDKSEYQRTNVEGAENVVKICIQKDIDKIIFTSTVAVYGFTNAKTDESGIINPFNDYGRTKFDAEEIFREWQRLHKSSLIIVRPTVIFGEGNRGNVFNLLNQIASGKFLMIGKGENKKSMAYIGNVAAFLDRCITLDLEYGLYNYVDTPDLTMNELVSRVQTKLNSKNGVGLRIPYWFGLMFGYAFDVFAKITRRNFPVSSLRVRKFVSSTEFESSKSNLDGFIPPFELVEGIDRTLHSEFISPDPNREIFYTE